MCLTLLFAGHDTSAHTIVRLFSELPRHPAVWARMAAEQQQARTPFLVHACMHACVLDTVGGRPYPHACMRPGHIASCPLSMLPSQAPSHCLAGRRQLKLLLFDRPGVPSGCI